jgi:purine nucleoside phosphorylase
VQLSDRPCQTGYCAFASASLAQAVASALPIGMTNMPEAKLAREAEICYATVGAT